MLRSRPPRPRRRLLFSVAAAAFAAGLAGGAAATSLFRSPAPSPRQTVMAQVALSALPADPGASGEASVVSTARGRELTIDVSQLGTTTGFYEVWLIDRDVHKMIPLGILAGGRGDFAIPAGVDLGQYPIVDISAEPLDGNPQHSGNSLLRGTIPA